MLVSNKAMERSGRRAHSETGAIDRGVDGPASGSHALDLAGADKGLVRVEEAARWLGLGRTKAWELVYKGTLHSVTIGRSRRIPVASLRAFVERLIEEGGV